MLFGVNCSRSRDAFVFSDPWFRVSHQMTCSHWCLVSTTFDLNCNWTLAIRRVKMHLNILQTIKWKPSWLSKIVNGRQWFPIKERPILAWHEGCIVFTVSLLLDERLMESWVPTYKLIKYTMRCKHIFFPLSFCLRFHLCKQKLWIWLKWCI